VVAREAHKENLSLYRRLRKVESKLLGVRNIEDAKSILMEAHSISASEAYDLIRNQAMSKRTTTEEVAAAIVHASEVLSLGKRKIHTPD